MSTPDDPRAEILDVVDGEDHVVGRSRRDEVYARRLRHRTVMIVVRRPSGEILVHRRTPTKLVAPSLYDLVVGGVVDAGESYDDAARRECAEEVGVTEVDLRPVFRARYDGDIAGAPWPQWISLYEVTWDGPVVPQESEVAWWAWLSSDELERRLAEAEWEFCPDSLWAWRRRGSGAPAD